DPALAAARLRRARGGHRAAGDAVPAVVAGRSSSGSGGGAGGHRRGRGPARGRARRGRGAPAGRLLAAPGGTRPRRGAARRWRAARGEPRRGQPRGPGRRRPAGCRAVAGGRCRGGRSRRRFAVCPRQPRQRDARAAPDARRRRACDRAEDRGLPDRARRFSLRRRPRQRARDRAEEARRDQAARPALTARHAVLGALVAGMLAAGHPLLLLLVPFAVPRRPLLGLALLAAAFGGALAAHARTAQLDRTALPPLFGHSVTERVVLLDLPRETPFGGWQATVRLRGERVALTAGRWV